MWERFHNTSPGDYEDTFIKAGDSETRTGLALKKQEESLDWAALAHWEGREKGDFRDGEFRGLAWDKLPAAHCLQV